MRYYPALLGRHDMTAVMPALVRDVAFFNGIGGVVVGIWIYDKFRDFMAKTMAHNGREITNRKKFIDNDKSILIDPMTYILGSQYKNFIRKRAKIRAELPSNVLQYLLNLEEIHKNKTGGYEKGVFIENVIEWSKSSELTKAMIKLQKEGGATLLFSPYFTNFRSNFNAMLEANLEFAQQGINNVKRIENAKLGIVICIDKTILKDDDYEDRLRNLFTAYKEKLTNVDRFFLKIDGIDLNDKNEEYEKIRKMVEIANKVLEQSVFFLGIHEFGLILSLDGLEDFSSPMYSNLRIIRNKKGNRKASSVGRYVRPKDMERLKKDDIRYLPCSCIYCSAYSNVSQIPPREWNILRKEHWIWWLNDEIKQVTEADDSGLAQSLKDRFSRTTHRDWVGFI
jgi:hypothetical protein